MQRIARLVNAPHTHHKMHLAKNLSMKVQYPDANFNYQLVNLRIQSRQVPVVVLLGWTGCQDKYLKKYSEIYENYGLITARYTAPSDAIFYNMSRMSQCAQRVVEFLHREKLDSGPVIFHSFSNGGALLYCNILEHLKKADQKLQVKGEIFDSAPSGRTSHIYRVFNTVIPGNALIRYPLSLFAGTCIIIYTSILRFISKLTNRTYLHLATIYDYLDAQKNACPQHCIYSKKDLFYEGIDDFVKSRQRKGVTMSEICFENSPHVKHFFMNKPQYLASVDSFLKTCLGKRNIDSKL